MILVCDRRSEQSHDAIAHDLVDHALVAMHGLHHPFNNGIEQLAPLFGVSVGEQLQRALEVGKKYRDLFALTFEGHLRGEDLLGEAPRRVDIRRREWTRRRARLQPCTTLAAELLSGRVARATVPAQNRETGAAFAAVVAQSWWESEVALSPA